MSIRPGAAAEIILGLGIAALGGFVLYETGAIKVAPVYAKVGPRDIPILVGAIMALLGLALAWQAWRAKPMPRFDPTAVMDAPGSKLDAPGTCSISSASCRRQPSCSSAFPTVSAADAICATL
jgi:hypothetical protein